MSDAGLPKITMMISFVAILFAGALAYVIMTWADANAAKAEAQLIIDDEVLVQEEQVAGELKVFEDQLAALKERAGVLVRGKMAVCNNSTGTITVSLLAATYLNDAGEFETFNSEGFGRQLWRIPAGEKQLLTYSQGSTNWDGDVGYYSMWLEAGGQEYPFAGTWPSDSEYCVRWTGA